MLTGKGLRLTGFIAACLALLVLGIAGHRILELERYEVGAAWVIVSPNKGYLDMRRRDPFEFLGWYWDQAQAQRRIRIYLDQQRLRTRTDAVSTPSLTEQDE